MDRRIFIISLIIFVNVLGVGLILPLLPFFALNLGASPLVIGFFIAALPFFSFLSGPPLGVLSDRYGRKPILLISIAGTVLGFLLLGVAQTLPLLFLARIIDGASAGNMSTAKAAIADITSREERVTKLGFTFAAESLGLIMGPVLGGMFAQYGFSVSAYIAAGIAGICFFLTLFFFDETHDRQPAGVNASRKLLDFQLGELLRVLRSGATQYLVIIVFLIQLLIMMMWGTLALFANQLYAFGGKEMGYVSAFAALVGIFSQTVLLKGLVRIASEKVIILCALVTMGAALLLIAASQEIWVMLVGVGLMASCFNTAMPTVVGLVSRISAEHEQGSVMGTVSSMISIASLAGPVFANAVFGLTMRGSYLVAGGLGLAAAGYAGLRMMASGPAPDAMVEGK
jgi:MFS transporter, DHA1 family, tetracycline resistance protein